MSSSVRALRTKIFAQSWPLDQEIRAAAAPLPSHKFLNNPTSLNIYVYLTRFVKALAEQQSGRPYSDLTVLDWGCGKGHVSKLLRDLHPHRLDSCDILSTSEDSAFGQQTPILTQFDIQVKPLEHAYILPYPDAAFDVVLSVGVLEHVPDDQASLTEIKRVLKPGGLFFCFFLPTTYAWTQKVAHMRGNFYHDRLYDTQCITNLVNATGLDPLDIWFRQLLPKNTVSYPAYQTFERLDQFVTEHTPLRHLATNIEFVAKKPA